MLLLLSVTKLCNTNRSLVTGGGDQTSYCTLIDQSEHEVKLKFKTADNSDKKTNLNRLLALLSTYC